MNKSAKQHLKSWDFPQLELNSNRLLTIMVGTHYGASLSTDLKLLVQDDSKECTAPRTQGTPKGGTRPVRAMVGGASFHTWKPQPEFKQVRTLLVIRAGLGVIRLSS